MLTFFQIRKTLRLNGPTVKATMTVDIEAGIASVIVTVDRFIRGTWEIDLRMRPDLRSPEGVNKWFSELVPVPGGEQGRMDAWAMFPHTIPDTRRAAA